ncbi:dipeptidase [Bacillus timonensis]|nr:dipeptidase [Bacillus timonensis]
MKIFDAHCDVLYKLWLNPKISFRDSKQLHITLKQLVETGSKVQAFAIYVPEIVRNEDKFEVALEMVQLFYEKILEECPNMKLVKNRHEIIELKEKEIGAMLTLEGCDAIGQSLTKLKTLISLGVSSVGLTWNYSNYVADGVLESRGAGLSDFGKQVVYENNKLKISTDVSHLSERGFWDVMEIADYPIASHSNVYNICKHVRNLSDNQLLSLIENNGMIGITFVPQFLTDNAKANISDILRHTDYICSLGGVNNLGFGSDFDGIENTVIGLESFKGYDRLINSLLKYYSESQVNGFLYDNFVRHLP